MGRDGKNHTHTHTHTRSRTLTPTGWFATPCDGYGLGWSHWSRGNKTPGPDPNLEGYLDFDSWPDTTEFGADELCATDLRYANGSRASLYSNANARTVLRHFEWMAAAGVDGVWKQRFVSAVSGSDARVLAFNDKVTENVAAGALATGRAWAMMYDISGSDDASLLRDLKTDWEHLVQDLRITAGPRYLHHRGRPILSIWGLGFTGPKHPITAATAAAVQDYFASVNVTLVGGVPTGWRDLSRDSQTDKAWAAVYRRFSVISPWTVGRYTSVGGLESVDTFLHTYIIPDAAAAKAAGADYLPVVWPGGSAHYEPRRPVQPFNRCPRDGGQFLWRQLWNALGVAKVDMLYGAMFDEVSEGTAYYKIASTNASTPANARLLYNDIDGTSVPTDWWMQLAARATAALHGGEVITDTMPLPPVAGVSMPAAADVLTFNDTLFHVTLAGSFPPTPSCIRNRDVHLLSGTVDSQTGGIVHVHVVNSTLLDYDLVFGPTIKDRGFIVHNVTAKLPCNASSTMVVSKGYAGCEDPSRGGANICTSIAFEDNPSPDVPPHYHWLLSIGVNPPLPPPPPVVCSELQSENNCDAASKCSWCASANGEHELCFTAGHTPATGWTCG